MCDCFHIQIHHKMFLFVRLQSLFVLVRSIRANVVSFRLKCTADVLIRNPCLVVLFFFFFLRNVHAAWPEQCPLRKEANFDFRNATELAWHSLTKQNMGDSEGCIYSGATFILQVPGRWWKRKPIVGSFPPNCQSSGVCSNAQFRQCWTSGGYLGSCSSPVWYLIASLKWLCTS